MKGFVTLSPNNKNIVNSNAIGCAAYYGNLDMLKHLLKSNSSSTFD